MPDISAFCPSCGRAVSCQPDTDEALPSAAPLSRDAFLAAAAYILVLPAIVLLAVPATRKVQFIRFHAWQALLFSAACVAAGLVTRLLFAVLSFVPLFAWLLAGLVALAIVFSWVAIVIKAALGDAYEFPVLGPWASALSAR